MTFIVLLSAIATIGFLANKYLDRKYGTKPNQELIDRISKIEHEVQIAFPNKFDIVRDTFKESEQKTSKLSKEFTEFKTTTAKLFVDIDKKLSGLHLGKLNGVKGKEVTELI